MRNLYIKLMPTKLRLGADILAIYILKLGSGRYAATRRLDDREYQKLLTAALVSWRKSIVATGGEKR